MTRGSSRLIPEGASGSGEVPVSRWSYNTTTSRTRSLRPERPTRADQMTTTRDGRPGCAAALLLLTACAAVWAVPLEPPMSPSEIPVEVQMPNDQWSDQVIYDQRQNGTENYRVQMSGVTVVLAPAEALMNFAPSDIMMDPGGPKPKNANPSQQKSRLTNLLLGFLSNKNH